MNEYIFADNRNYVSLSSSLVGFSITTPDNTNKSRKWAQNKTIKHYLLTNNAIIMIYDAIHANIVCPCPVVG